MSAVATTDGLIIKVTQILPSLAEMRTGQMNYCGIQGYEHNYLKHLEFCHATKFME